MLRAMDNAVWSRYDGITGEEILKPHEQLIVDVGLEALYRVRAEAKQARLASCDHHVWTWRHTPRNKGGARALDASPVCWQGFFPTPEQRAERAAWLAKELAEIRRMYQ